MNETIPGSDVLEQQEADIARFSGWLDAAREIAETVLAPRANEIDRMSVPPEDNIRRLAAAGLLGLSTPERYGGAGAPGTVLRAYSEILSAACGVTTFVQGQHLSACALINGGENEALKERVLPLFARGERLCGVAFSHLRRPGPPTMRVTCDGEAYVFNGVAPWFTGWGVMDDVVLGGTLEDGRLLYTVVPLDGPGLTATPPMELCTMNASGTVELLCKDFRAEPAQAMKTITMTQMGSSDLGAILGVTPQIFGMATASIALVRRLAEQRSNPLFFWTCDALEGEMVRLRRLVDAWRDRTTAEGYKENALAARAACIEFGVRAAHAAVTATGGSANARNNTAQRLFREAMFYTLTAQTRDVQAATLERIIAQSECTGETEEDD